MYVKYRTLSLLPWKYSVKILLYSSAIFTVGDWQSLSCGRGMGVPPEFQSKQVKGQVTFSRLELSFKVIQAAVIGVSSLALEDVCKLRLQYAYLERHRGADCIFNSQ